MFEGCTSLTTVDLTGFKTSSTTNMNSMFRNSSTTINMTGLHKIDISNLTKGSNKGMFNMFSGAKVTNSEEIGRCFVAWGNELFYTTPKKSGSNTITFNMGQSNFTSGAELNSPAGVVEPVILNGKNKLDVEFGWVVSNSPAGGLI